MGIVADHTFTITKGYENNKADYTIKTDDSAAIRHLIAELKLSEEEKAVSGGFDLTSIQKAVAEAKEIGTSQQKLLDTFKQRYPNGINSAVAQAVQGRMPTFLYFDSYLNLHDSFPFHDRCRRLTFSSNSRGCRGERETEGWRGPRTLVGNKGEYGRIEHRPRYSITIAEGARLRDNADFVRWKTHSSCRGSFRFALLKWFSRQLERAGKPGLDYRWVICSVRGVDRIPGFVSLFRGNNLHIAAVVDVQVGHKQKIENARKSLEEKHLLALDNYTGQADADIEDVLGREFYMALMNEAYELRGKDQVPAAKPGGAPERVAKEAEAHFAVLPPHRPEFSHEVPAEWLFQRGDDGAKLPGFNDAPGRMEKLIGDLNALMP